MRPWSCHLVAMRTLVDTTADGIWAGRCWAADAPGSSVPGAAVAKACENGGRQLKFNNRKVETVSVDADLSGGLIRSIQIQRRECGEAEGVCQEKAVRKIMRCGLTGHQNHISEAWPCRCGAPANSISDDETLGTEFLILPNGSSVRRSLVPASAHPSQNHSWPISQFKSVEKMNIKQCVCFICI